MLTYMLRFSFDPKDPRCETLNALCDESDAIRSTLRASGVTVQFTQSLKENEFEVFVRFADWQKDTMLYLCRAFCRESRLTLECFNVTNETSYRPL